MSRNDTPTTAVTTVSVTVTLDVEVAKELADAAFGEELDENGEPTEEWWAAIDAIQDPVHAVLAELSNTTIVSWYIGPADED